MAPGPLDPAPVTTTTTVLEQCYVSPSPAPAADQPRCLPLTFFDLVFWDFPPVQRILFYANADVQDFQATELPRFKKSLAAALHHFYPLAGMLNCELGTEGVAPPEIAFADGDSVRLTVAVSGDDFHDLAGDHPRDTARLRPLLPSLLPQHGGGSHRQDVLAVQVTVFPGAGICLGTTLHHAVADGSSYVHFMKTWAAIHRLLGPADLCTKEVVGPPPPLFDRGVVRDDAGLRDAFVRDHRDLAAAGDARLADWDLSRRSAGGVVVLATFRFTAKQLARLGTHVEAQTAARCSPCALACGASWAGILHARRRNTNTDDASPSPPDACFGFVTGCKPRVNPPIPGNYFGNCLGLCRVELGPTNTTTDNNTNTMLAAASTSAAAIWRVIAGLAEEEGRALRDARGWVRCVREYASRRAVTVAGSPKLGVYGVDFGGGWGRPRKVEIASVERTGALALAEDVDDDGGIEVGLALPSAEMEAFRSFYHQLLASLD
ncbi:hypothetical protein PR202_gb10082 [Eleusine coracana subsp. coracana]|uniref:Uncharacterized protein n=1 Tax=Eleusine coracana subsp. coracana TaxID=191504 RepID=A0AAV5EGL9_ELECO|nr:hypothetical protein QOZ80_2BG0205370 [Eleusine coracana subsp. coracana]GJN22513.1 hypothetical protein PR202_gb10082 [Eleusine coracana subsp. coracana]